MRFHFIVLFMILVGCGPQVPGAGLEGHPCRTGFAANWACDDGLRCMGTGDGDICVACGEPGEICCAVSGGSEYCNGGLACEGGNYGYDSDPGHCTATCGQEGMPCCENDTCPSGGQCVSGTCKTLQQDPCFGGTEPHVVYVVEQDCSYKSVTFWTDTAQQAEECRQQLTAAAIPGEEVCALDQKAEETIVCGDHGGGDTDQLYLPSCSTTQLGICEAYYCADCTWTTGECPQP